jgi:hypothetical protein
MPARPDSDADQLAELAYRLAARMCGPDDPPVSTTLRLRTVSGAEVRIKLGSAALTAAVMRLRAARRSTGPQ